MAVTCQRPWLQLDLGGPHQVLSWAPANPGPVTARHILWREVRNADLTPEFDVRTWLADELTARGQTGAVAMLTSRNVTRFRDETAGSGRILARCIATVGLSNAERIGTRQAVSDPVGTINLAVHLNAGLTAPAMLEAMTIAAQARTAAILEFGPDLPTGRATGTGTDCICIAAPAGDTAYAGLHTDPGEAIGRAVYDAVASGTRDWMEEFG